MVAKKGWKEVPEGESGSAGSRCRHTGDRLRTRAAEGKSWILTASRWRRLHGWSWEQDASRLWLAGRGSRAQRSVWLCGLLGGLGGDWHSPGVTFGDLGECPKDCQVSSSFITTCLLPFDSVTPVTPLYIRSLATF
jgi:hypothetical protein